MRERIIGLCQEYTSEKDDYFHRVIGDSPNSSTSLYQLWQSENTSEDFKTWSQNNGNIKFRGDQVLYLNENELEQYQVCCSSEEKLAYTRGVWRFAYCKQVLNINADYNEDSLYPIKDFLHIDNRSNSKEGRSYALVIPSFKRNLYAIKMNTSSDTLEYRVHHSSLTMGNEVIFAAEAIAKHGKFTRISDRSGHYKPNLYVFCYGLNYMNNMDLNLHKTSIEVTVPENFDSIYFDSAVKFLDLYVNNGFDSEFFFGEGSYTSCQEAFSHLTTQDKAIYFATDKNELYEFNRHKNQIIAKSYKEKYDSLAPIIESYSPISNAEHGQYNENELQIELNKLMQQPLANRISDQESENGILRFSPPLSPPPSSPPATPPPNPRKRIKFE